MVWAGAGDVRHALRANRAEARDPDAEGAGQGYADIQPQRACNRSVILNGFHKKLDTGVVIQEMGW